MKKLIATIISIVSIYSSCVAKDLTDESGLPVIFHVEDMLSQPLEKILGYNVSVEGFLYFNPEEEIAYLFKDIASLVAFKFEEALLIEVPIEQVSQFDKRSLCHVSLYGVVKRDGLSLVDPVLSEVKTVRIIEVFSLGLSSKETSENYVCFLQKFNMKE